MTSALETSISKSILGVFANATAYWQGAPLMCVFDAAYAETLGMSNARPAISCATDEIVGMEAGQGLLIDEVGYTVRELQPDGMGVTRVILEKT